MSAVKFSLRDVLTWVAAIGCILATYRSLPPGRAVLPSFAIVISAAAWHLAPNDWVCLALSAFLGMLVLYLDIAAIVLSPSSTLGSFPEVTLMAAAPVGIISGGIFGAIVRVFRQVIARMLGRPLGMGGSRGFMTMLTVGYAGTAVWLLAVSLWKASLLSLLMTDATIAASCC